MIEPNTNHRGASWPVREPMPFNSWTRALFEAIDDAVFVHDEHGNILEANPAACRRLGYTREELLRLNTRDIDAPEFAAGFENRLQTQRQAGSFRCEGIHRTKIGRRIYVDINTSAIQLDGKPAVLAVMRDITNRKETEEALGKQSHLLQSILDNMSDAIVVADAEGRIVLFNPMAEHIFGPGVVPGNFTLFQADRTTRLAEFPVGRCVRGESFDGVELFVRHAEAPAGLWISVAGRPLRESDGTLKGGVLVCIDVTEHKRVEKQLRDSQTLYESLVELLPQNIFRKDRQGRLTFGNARYCASLKRPLGDLLGKTDFDLFPHDIASKYVHDDQELMRTRQTLDTIEEHYLPDGSRLYVHVVKTPVANADNEIIGVQGIFWDVTQEVLAHEAVANSEKRYRQLTEATMDGIVVIDPKGAIVLFNPAAERMFGYAAAEILGMPAKLLVPTEFKELHAAAWRIICRRAARIAGPAAGIQGPTQGRQRLHRGDCVEPADQSGQNQEPPRSADGANPGRDPRSHRTQQDARGPGAKRKTRVDRPVVCRRGPRNQQPSRFRRQQPRRPRTRLQGLARSAGPV